MKPDWFERDIIAPVSETEREAVRVAQRALRVPETGEMDTATRGALRGAQYLFGLPITGSLDLATAIAVDGLRPWSLNGDPEERHDDERRGIPADRGDLRNGAVDGAGRPAQLRGEPA